MDQLNTLENTVLLLKKNVKSLEDKLQSQAKPDDDKLVVYKQQAQIFMKKKEKLQEDIQRAEEEMANLDRKIQEKDSQLKKNRGPGYKNKDEIDSYAKNLREKSHKYKKLKDELKEMQSENAILNRTY